MLEKEYGTRIQELEKNNEALKLQVKELGAKLLSVREVISIPWFYRTKTQRDIIEKF